MRPHTGPTHTQQPLVDMESPGPEQPQCIQGRGLLTAPCGGWKWATLIFQASHDIDVASLQDNGGGRVCLSLGFFHSASWVGGAHSFTLAVHKPSTCKILHLMWHEIPIQYSVSIRALQVWFKSRSDKNSNKTSNISSHCMPIGACPVIWTRTTTVVLNSM